jgi:hypothetical protein
MNEAELLKLYIEDTDNIETNKNKMKNKNRLPKSWVVKNDESVRFVATVLSYMNENDKRPGIWLAKTQGYFGFVDGWVSAFSPKWLSEVRVLTIDEFVSMTSDEPEFKYGDKVMVWDDLPFMSHKDSGTFLCMTSTGKFVSENEQGVVFSWDYCEHVSKIKEVTMSEVAAKFGCEVKIVK